MFQNKFFLEMQEIEPRYDTLAMLYIALYQLSYISMINLTFIIFDFIMLWFTYASS